MAALREHTEPGDVVLADPETSYWIAAAVPVYVGVAPPTHVGDTKENRPYERVREWNAFVRGAPWPGPSNWLVIDKERVENRALHPADLPRMCADVLCKPGP